MTAQKTATTPHETAAFGGVQFTYELEGCFEAQAKLLAELLDSQISHLPHPVGLILGTVHRNAVAICALAPDELVSETYLVMRILVDSSITAAYLLTGNEAERQNYLSVQPQTAFLNSAGPEEMIRQSRELTQIELIPSHRLKPLRDRIDLLCEKTGANRDSWLMVSASIFPHTAEMLAGTLWAYEFPFSTRAGKDAPLHSRDEFSLLFFMGTEVLYELIVHCSRVLDITPLKDQADLVHRKAIELMQRMHAGIDDPAQGGWDRLERIEHWGRRRLSRQFTEFEDGFRLSYEAGIIAPTLKQKDSSATFKHAALYLRRALNDLRAVWVLLSTGYTSQAATCAGSLFESSLACACLLRAENVRAFETKLSSATGNDFPWGPMEMSKMVCAEGGDVNNADPDYQNAWRSLYARYVWLSQLRHSTFQSVLHDVRGSNLNCGEYVIMALPNCGEADLPVKLGIAVGCLADIQQAIRGFVKALGFRAETGNVMFDDRMRQAHERLAELVQKFSAAKNPITIARTRFLLRHPPVERNHPTAKS